MKRLKIKTNQREEYIDITQRIEDFVKQNFKDFSGIMLVFVPHTSAGIFINEGYDLNVKRDLRKVLNRIVEGIHFEHAEGNSDAHFKTLLTGNSIQLIIENGEIMLGRWQSIIFGEFDGPREREIWLKAI